MQALDGVSRYKVMGSCITPRPIAWITSRSSEGVLNVAPFSFFNAVGSAPPTVVIGMVQHPERRLKDTPVNIRDTGEFVINLVNRAHAETMNLTSIEAPSDVDEAVLAGLALAPSVRVGPPRIDSAPASFECRLTHFIETGVHQVAVLAEVVYAHVRDEFILDPERIRIDVPAMQLIARLHGAGWYSQQTDTFELLRPSWPAA